MVREERKCLFAEGVDGGLVGVSSINPLSSQSGTSRSNSGVGFKGTAHFEVVSFFSLFARQSRPNYGPGSKGNAL